MAASEESKLAAVSNVDIDDSGRFKYVLVNCYLGEKSKFVVRVAIALWITITDNLIPMCNT